MSLFSFVLTIVGSVSIETSAMDASKVTPSESSVSPDFPRKSLFDICTCWSLGTSSSKTK